MSFDECIPYPATYEYAKASTERTLRWAKRGKDVFNNERQSLFGIVQGGEYEDLRKYSAIETVKMGFDGYAIGGLAVGEPTEVMYSMIEVVNAVLPEDKPRYLMGVGTPINILEGIDRGVDMFDCVMPTRNGRNGQIFTSEGTINLRNKKWENDFSPLDENGVSFVDKQYTKAYVHHLTICKEMMAAQIASLHNVAFYLWLVGEARKHILAGDFKQWKSVMVEKLGRRL
ncbi:MAG: queuine tRNA-ribosyltransferase family protein, partial [Alistipes sp.]|nr:queuine tRNA-ribosyltransferase family protein [Alistipes sp.]